MKNKIFNISNIALGVVTMANLWSCSAENPFESEGEGTIRLHTVVNAVTTRADDEQSASDPMQELKDKCIVYISGEKGLIYKKVGLHNVDEHITLKTGHYVAEAWTGDSVTASFDKKFFRGYEPFDVTKGSDQNIALNCKIQNVVVSINTSTIDPNLMKDDYTISIKNSRGEIVFNKENAPSERAYFMMPNGDTTLEYTITGSRQDGETFTKSGSIEGVQRAHHYILNFEYNGQNISSTGAVFLKIKIKDEEISDSQNVTVHSRPTITGVDFKIEKQQVYTSEADIPESLNVQLCGFKGLKELAVTSPSASELGIPSDSINLFEADANLLKPYKDAGLIWTSPELNPSTGVATASLTIPKNMIERLSTEKTTEHVIRITIKDGDTDPKTHSATIRIARNDGAIKIEDPIVLENVDQSSDYLSTTPYSFTIPYTLSDEFEGIPGVEYSKVDEDNWIFVPVTNPSKVLRKSSMTRAPQKYTITIKGLEPGTNYKYRAACGEFHGKEYTFTTESKFIIPNASMEDWSNFSENSKVLLPALGGVRSFWDTGNHGSSTMSVTLTQGSTDMYHSGNKAAKLRSQFVGIGSIGKFAAGNLFVGIYKETIGTNGKIEFGQPFNGSHPKALSLWANYRPGTATSKSAGTYTENGKECKISQGDTDKAQIYVAISTTPVTVDTSNHSTLFNPEAQNILAYGEVTWDSDFGPDGALQQKTIELKYNDRANNEEAKYLIIVCSASKYGDYFCGGEGSTMYVDDFELIYE